MANTKSHQQMKFHSELGSLICSIEHTNFAWVESHFTLSYLLCIAWIKISELLMKTGFKAI